MFTATPAGPIGFILLTVLAAPHAESGINGSCGDEERTLWVSCYVLVTISTRNLRVSKYLFCGV